VRGSAGINGFPGDCYDRRSKASKVTGALLFLGIGVLLLFVGFMSVIPEGLDPAWRRPADLA
jgi:hypothetical protein